jgi:hypothetical protein
VICSFDGVFDLVNNHPSILVIIDILIVLLPLVAEEILLYFRKVTVTNQRKSILKLLDLLGISGMHLVNIVIVEFEITSLHVLFPAVANRMILTRQLDAHWHAVDIVNNTKVTITSLWRALKQLCL